MTSTNTSDILFYGDLFDIEPNANGSPEPQEAIDMYLLKRRYLPASNGNNCMGNIFLVTDIQSRLQLVPNFGPVADRSLTPYNSMDSDLVQSFYWNNFEAKETFHTSLSYL
jgi:hypothetical protein